MKAFWIRFVLMGPFAPILVPWAEAQMQTTMPQTTLQQAALAGLAIGLAGFVTMEALGAGVLGGVALSEAPAIVAAIGGMLAQGGLGTLAGGITIGVLGSSIAISLLAAGLVVVVVAPAIVAAMQQNAARSYAGPSGEMTDDTAAALQKALYPPPIHLNFNQLSATDPTLNAPSNVPRGHDPDSAGIGGGQVANPPGALQLDLSPAGQSNLDLTPAADPDVEGLNVDAVDTVSLDATVDATVDATGSEAGEGWIDGVCRDYATGAECAEYVHHEYVHRKVSWPSTLFLLSGLGWPLYRRTVRWA